MMNAMGAMCMHCHDAAQSAKENKLNRMEQMLSRVTPSEQKAKPFVHFNWGIHSRCKFGVTCPKLRTMDSKCDSIVRRLEPKLITVATDNDSRCYHEILQLLRGDFPSVYHTMEVLHAKNRSSES